MTTIVKKRLQAVVALLVCFMVLFAAFPSVPFNNEVKSATDIPGGPGYTIYFSKEKSIDEWHNVPDVYIHFWGGTGVSDTKAAMHWAQDDRLDSDPYKQWVAWYDCGSKPQHVQFYYSNAGVNGGWNYRLGGDSGIGPEDGKLYYCNGNSDNHWDGNVAKMNYSAYNTSGPTITNETVYFDPLNNSKFHDEVVSLNGFEKTANTTWLQTTATGYSSAPQKMYVVTYNSSNTETSIIQMDYSTSTKLWSASVPSHTSSGSSAVEVSYIRFINYDATSTAIMNAGNSSTNWGYSNFSTPVSRTGSTQANPYIVKGTLKNTSDSYFLNQAGLRSVGLKGGSNRSILQGVKYYNYFYDEQIVYEMLGGQKDPSDLKVKTAQYKNPYSIFNQAVMLSSYHDATSHPMYLGEFWLGGNDNENTNGTGYKSTPSQVTSGKKDRSDGVVGRSVNYDNWFNNYTYYKYVNGIYTSDTANLYGSQTVDVANLTKFVWGTNLAFRGTDSAQKYYHIIGTDLVDDTISTNVSSDLYLTPTKKGKALPYFDEKFLSGDRTAYVTNKYSSFTTLTGGNPVGKVYDSIFPLYTRDVTFTNNGTSLSGTNPDSWIRTSSDENDHNWGSLLTVNDNGTVGLSGMYTFDSHIDSVRVNTHGGASENTNGGASPSGQSSTLASLGITGDKLGYLNTKYNANWSDTDTVGSDTFGTPYNAVKAKKDANSSEPMNDDEMAILNAGGYFYDATGKVKDTEGQPGFFPFNKSGISTSELQYGFGVRLDIKFNVGTTGMKGSDPMIFRFSGDDDVWVFIDGKLVLDMGGGHKNAIGEINFSLASDNVATTYATDSDATNIWNHPAGDTKVNKTTSAFVNACKNGQDHELTMFYMERGKLNSNMSIMFNFIAPEITPVEEIPETPAELPPVTPPSSSNKTNDSIFKIVEETDFSSVNTGLLDLTKKAAENDVFNYTVQSNVQRNAGNNTADADMKIGGFAFATGPTDIARNPNITGIPTTTLIPTGPDTSSGVLTGMNKVIYLDTGNNTQADTALYKAVKTRNESNEDDVTYIGRKVGPHLYAFPYWSGGAEFIYSNERNSGITDGGTADNLNSCSTICIVDSPVDGKIYTDSDTVGVDSNYVRKDNSKADQNWNTVANVNYVWKEAYAPDTGTSSLYLTNTTTGSGTFNLLYGLSDDESSATFTNQFYDKSSNEGQIRVNIAQRMVARPDNPSTPVNSWSGGTRNMGQYYNTKAKIVRKKADGTYDTSSVEWRNETIVAGVGGVVEIGGVAVDSTDMSVTITNMVTSGSVTVSKGIEWFGGTSSNNDEFYFKVTISNVFGLANNNPSLSEYAKITYDVSNTIDGTFSSYQNLRTGVPDNGKLANEIGNCGLIKIKAGQTAKIEGLPEGTDVVIEELHLSQQKASEEEWNAIYNKRSTGNAPTITATGLSNSIVNNEIGMKMSGTTYERLSRILEVSFTNGQDYFNTTAIKLVLRKTWDGHPSGETKPTITYLLERTTVNPATATDDAWSIVTSTGNTDGKYTIPSNTDSLEVKGEGIVDKADNDTFYYYRIREYGENGASLILTDGGWYNQNYKVIYEVTENNSTTKTNIGIANATYAETDVQKLVAGVNDNPGTLTLSVKNKYYATGESTGQPLPKTGARGVYAIVTFGAFAITIAGVALLIYRKKLQTVNIYAVKGSEKPKE